MSGRPVVRPVVAPWPSGWLPAVGGVPDVSGLRRSAILLEDGRLYLERFHVVETAGCQVRVHHWLASDDQRALHDHPWANVSTVLAGELVEHGPGGAVELAVGAVVSRRAADPHRVELVSGEAWTLFVTGPIVRRWGFHTERGWVHWSSWPHAGRYED